MSAPLNKDQGRTGARAFGLLLLLFFCAALLLTGCGRGQPPVFGFIFRCQERAAVTELNTFRGTYTKEVKKGKSRIMVQLALTPAELKQIQKKMVEMDLFNYPPRLQSRITPPAVNGVFSTYNKYFFLVKQGARLKRLWWDDALVNGQDEIFKLDTKTNDLRGLIALIQSIIAAKAEYKALTSE